MALLQLPQWVPLSVVKGGTAANMLVKGLDSDFMKDTTVKTLVQVCAVRLCPCIVGEGREGAGGNGPLACTATS